MTFDATDFQNRMTAYFVAEKRESVLFLLVGVAALAAAIALLLRGGVYRGMVLPLCLVGLIQVAVGGSVYWRTDGQVAQIRRRVADEPATLRRDETTRMERVMANFRLYKMIEIVILGSGVALALAFAYGRALHAAGIGCLLQGSIMLVLDLFAEGRGYDYLAALARLP